MDFDLKSHLYENINGHFDPFCLSIEETAEDTDGWRKKIATLPQSVSRYKNVKDLDLLAHFTSIHEQDHFIRYSSSELGLMITFALQLLCTYRISNFKGGNINTQKAVDIYENMISCLYEPKFTQGFAVELFNVFFSKFENVKMPLFITKNPNAPCIPHSAFGFKQIMEASAVICEMTIIETHLPAFSEDKTELLLRKQLRDYKLYFQLIDYLKEKVYFSSAISALIKYSMDVRVPIFGSPLQGTVDWEEFHPGWRLYFLSNALSLQYKIRGEKKPEDHVKGLSRYAYTIQQNLLDDIEEIASKKGRYRMWNNPNVIDYEINSEKLIESLDDYAKRILHPNFSEWKPVIDHLYSSHKLYKKRREKDRLDFYGSKVLGILEEEKQIMEEKIRNDDIGHSYVLFSNFNGSIQSHYGFSEPSKFVVLRRFFLNKVLIGYIKSIRAKDVRQVIIKNYTTGTKNAMDAFVIDCTDEFINFIYNK